MIVTAGNSAARRLEKSIASLGLRVLLAGLGDRRLAGTPAWTQERLVRGVRRFIAEGLAKKDLLTPAERPAAPDRLLAVVAGIVRSDPTATLRAIAARLEAIREPTPRGGAQWKPGSVAHVIARAKRLGMIPPDQPDL